MTEYVRLHPEEREAIAQRVAQLLREETVAAVAPVERGLLSASEIAQRYGVSREWVYEHKAELGAVAMGTGARPRLRFDPARVAAALETRRDPVAAPEDAPRRTLRRHRQMPAPSAELLPIRGRGA